MSQQRPERASNIRASGNMNTMTAAPFHASAESGDEEIWLRFTKDMWNESQPVRQETKSPSTGPKEVGNQKRRPTTIETDNDLATKVPNRSPAQPKQCKVKVIRFQYGGAKVNIEGQHMNDITVTAPCLQQTCANCRKWHPHLMRNSSLVDACLDNEHIAQSSDILPPTSHIDPIVLDNTWQTYQIQHISMSNVPGLTVSSACAQQPPTPAQTPVDLVLEAQRRPNQDTGLPTIHNSDETATTAPQKYNTILPISLLRPTSLALSNKTHWRSASRQHRTVKLSFPTDKGKSKFKTLLHERVRRKIKREYDRLRRVTKQLIRKAILMGEQDAVVASVRRRRYKVKLVFRSMEGRKAYGRLIERYSS